MRYALITGGTGFVSGHLPGCLEASGYGSVGLDVSSPKDRGPAIPQSVERVCQWEYCDVTSAESVRRALDSVVGRLGSPSLVFHLAAQASVARSFDDPASTYRVNVEGTAVLLEELAVTAPDARVLIPSSAHVYGRPTRPDGVLDEDSPLEPDTHYGASKVAQEMIGSLYLSKRGLPVFLARAFNHVGPGQGPGYVFADFARRLVELERAGGGVLNVGNLDAQRDFLDVRDVVSAYLTILDRGEPGVIYNVASGRPRSIRELLHMFLAQVTVAVDVQLDRALLRPSDVPVLVGDAGRLRRLGWEASHDLVDTVRETLDYWRKTCAAGFQGVAE